MIASAITHLAHSTPERFRFSSTDFDSHLTAQTETGAPRRENGHMKAVDTPGLGIVPDLKSVGEPVARHSWGH
jgi:L-alanine-DL-glutamate epimerase-like enolase superfamily enzyme